MKNSTLLILIAIAVIFISATLPSKTKVTFVCNSAPNAKRVMDTYFKLGYELESVTTQLISMRPNNNPYTDFNINGGIFEREYLIVLSK